MSRKRWEERWQRETQGWEQSVVNDQVVEHSGWLMGAGRTRVLVPLCGRSVDLDWLAERFDHVVGLELVEEPVRRFFAERDLEPVRSAAHELEAWDAGAWRILRGDALLAKSEDVGRVDALYDRAALIALPPDLRPRYADRMDALTRTGSRMLLITLAYDQSLSHGPPYSVTPDEVETLFGSSWTLQPVDRSVPSRMPPRFDEVDVERTAWLAERL